MTNEHGLIIHFFSEDDVSVHFISTTLRKFVSLSCRGGEADREKALSVVASLPLGPYPAYAVPIDTNDLIWPKFTAWRHDMERTGEGSVDIALVAALVAQFSGSASLTSDVILKLMKELVLQNWLKRIPDPELALHHANILLASLIGAIDPSPSNSSIGEIAQSWNKTLLAALKLPENRRAQKLLSAKGYLGWLTLLIAEIAKRRGVHHHDLFLIKELMDKTFVGWDPESVRICGDVISAKFSYAQLWKQKISKWFT
jgi:hypothetical protein